MAMQPSEPEEEVKEIVGREDVRVPYVDREPEGARILEEEQEEELDERPDTGWLEGNWVWVILVALVVGFVAWVLVISLT
jgi:hypothetical protein